MNFIKKKDLPYGVCKTFFYNSSDRKTKLHPRPCFMAYAGAAHTYKSKRFPIDTLGAELALLLALDWRWQRGPLEKRASDFTRVRNNKMRRLKKSLSWKQH